jgi:putative cell wall-binding protein
MLGLIVSSIWFIDIYAQAEDQHRIAGSGRYQTAVEIAREGWGTNAPTVVLARGDLYPDALAGAPLAAEYEAPILLTKQKNLPSSTRKALIELKTKKVVILGGTKAIEPSVEKELDDMGIKVNRVSGSNRYDTAVQIAKELNSNKEEVFIATGSDFPDALSIASYAAQKKRPILLTKKDSVPTQVKNYVKGAKKVYIVGGTNVISDNVKSNFSNAERIAGISRYSTAIEVISKFYDSNPKMYISTGTNFADALTGSALAAKNNTAIMLVDKNKLVGDVNFLFHRNNVKSFDIFGGTSAVSDKVLTEVGTVTQSVGDSIGAANVSSKLIKANDTQINAINDAEKKLNSNGSYSITINKSTASTLKPGQYILFPPSDDHPSGFIGKVLNSNGSTGYVTIGQPSVEEVFTKLSIDHETSLDARNIIDLSLNDGVSIDINNKNVSSLTQWKDELGLSSDANPSPLTLNVDSVMIENATKYIHVNGKLSLDEISASLTTEYEKTKGLTDMTLEFNANQESELTFDYQWDGKVDIPKTIPDYRWSTLNNIKEENTFLIGSVSYQAGTVPLLGSESLPPMEIPITMTVTYTVNSKGDINAEASYIFTKNSQKDLNGVWKSDKQTIEASVTEKADSYQYAYAGKSTGKLTNEIGMNIGLNIGSINPINIKQEEASNSTMSGHGASTFNVLTGDILNETGCLQNNLKIDDATTVSAILNSLSYDATKGNSYQKEGNSKTIFSKSQSLCTHAGETTGYITDQGDTALGEVKIKAIKDGKQSDTTYTALDGQYELSLEEGIYSLIFSKSGYQQETIDNVKVKEGESSVLPSVHLTKLSDVGAGNVKGVISDSLSGELISGAKLNLRKGYQVKTGPVIDSQVTDENGNYEWRDLSAGLYTIEVSKEGYIPYTFNIRSIKGLTIDSQNGFLSPLLEDDQTRFVLNWGRTPMDLDAHLTGPSKEAEERFHLYWNTKEYREDETLMAKMDAADSNSAISPETITIYEQQPGIYRFSVFNYSYRLHTGTTALSKSGAKIDIYQGNKLTQTYYVPENTEGKLWTAFELNGNITTPTNSVSDAFTFYSTDLNNHLDTDILPSLAKEKE